MKNIVILISGSGSNMAAIVRRAQDERWDERLGARVAVVISNKADAKGLVFAQAQGIATAVLDHKAFDSREAFDAALVQEIDRHAPALVVLAGFMRILTPAFVAHYAGRLLNIHPSLLPAFPGLHTHERAIQAGCKFAGATVHEVTPDPGAGGGARAPGRHSRCLGRARAHAGAPHLPAGGGRLSQETGLIQSPMRAKRGCVTPSIVTVSANMAAGRTHSPCCP